MSDGWMSGCRGLTDGLSRKGRGPETGKRKKGAERSRVQREMREGESIATGGTAGLAGIDLWRSKSTGAFSLLAIQRTALLSGHQPPLPLTCSLSLSV